MPTGAYPRAVAEIRQLTDTGKLEGNALAKDGEVLEGPLIHAATDVYFQARTAVQQDMSLSGMQQESLVEEFEASIVGLLEKARAVGFFATPANRETLTRNPDYVTLQKRGDFQQLLNSLDYK